MLDPLRRKSSGHGVENDVQLLCILSLGYFLSHLFSEHALYCGPQIYLIYQLPAELRIQECTLHLHACNVSQTDGNNNEGNYH